MTQSTFSPTVMVLDDDPAVLGLLRRGFHGNTSLGVLVVDNLADAKRFIDEKRLSFDAIISDLSVVPERQDPINDLHDGLDLLRYLSEHRPNVSQYVLSVWADLPTYRDRSQKAKLPVRNWFQKLNFGSSGADRTAPWNWIEREMYEARLREEAAGQTEEIKDSGEFSDLVRHKLRPIIRTYLQDLPDMYEIRFPIEVVCRSEEGYWLADALHLGILQPGVGGSLEDALEDLGARIVEQYLEFQHAEPARVEGYAQKAFSALKSHVVAGTA